MNSKNNTQKSIVHLCLCGPVTDGWNYQDNLLPKYHKKMGMDVTIITSHWIWGEDGKLTIDPREEYYNENGILVKRLDIAGGRTLSDKFKKYESLVDTLEKCSPDILFIHGCQYMDVVAVVKYVKKRKPVVYVDNHADYSNSATNWLSKNVLHKIVWRSMAKRLEPVTTKFYGVLPARVDFLHDLYGIDKKKIELLVMGVDDEVAENVSNRDSVGKTREKFGITGDEYLLVSGGKIDRAKCQTLDLMKAVKQMEGNLKLIVFGSVEEELKEQFADLVDGQKIIYAGWLSAYESNELFAIADLVVFPGRHSVFWEQVVGLGIPLMVKRWDGTDHVDVNGNCVFLEKSDEDEMKDKISMLYKDLNQRKVLKQRAEAAKQNFLYSTIAKKSIDQL